MKLPRTLIAIAFVVSVLPASAATSPTAAPDSRLSAACDSGQGLTPDQWIAACSAVLGGSRAKMDRAIAFYNRARAHRAKGDNAGALADYTRAIEILPDFAIAYQNRGVVYNAMGDRQRAIADYSRAIALQPKLAVAYNNRGVALSASGNAQAAIQDFTKAIALEPGNPWSYNNRGDAYFRLRNWNAAIADYSRALSLKPDLTYALYARGAAKTYRGDSISGRADMEAASRMNERVAEEQARDGIMPITMASN
ncbi:MAG: tetratricopeptide repeat protein [Alphaproteobacteria bacterium]|nr:tetratricopeptide repeat protein [Alphaproteobacteria bacterium]